MKPTTRLRTLFLLFMVFNITVCYGQYTRKAGELKDIFKKMHTTTDMEEWKGTQTCKRETLIKFVKENIALTPEINSKIPDKPDLSNAMSGILIQNSKRLKHVVMVKLRNREIKKKKNINSITL